MNFTPLTHQTLPHKARGFTLIELMIVVAIIAILTTIALPSYQNYVLRSHRVLAKTALLNLAAQEEKYYSIKNTYATLATLGINSSVTDSSNNAYYTLSVGDYTTPANAPTSTFTATATATGTQATDTTCATFTVDYLGKQSSSSSATGCW